MSYQFHINIISVSYPCHIYVPETIEDLKTIEEIETIEDLETFEDLKTTEDLETRP